MVGVVGVEIAEAIWPIVKVLGLLVALFGGVALVVRSIRKGGENRVKVEILQEADEARTDRNPDALRPDAG